MGKIVVYKVEKASQLMIFIRLAWSIYRRDSVWVPPLISDQLKGFDPRRNPFFQHSEAVLFVAEKAGVPLGRIAAVKHNRHLEIHADDTGFFGWFECRDEPEVAAELMAAARAWLIQRGLKRIRGPINFAMNQECGCLLDGYEFPPAFLMGHNPPYYRGLFEGLGFKKAHDLFAFRIKRQPMPRGLGRLAERFERNSQYTIRALNMRKYDDEILLIYEMQKKAWSQNWGEVPLSKAEFQNAAGEMKIFIDPDLIYLAFCDGEPVGLCVTLPDFNQALKKADGKLFPFGWLKILWHKRRIDQCRIFLLGTLERHRMRGLEAALIFKMVATILKKGYRQAELSWLLESNLPVIRMAERFGADRYKTYRLYEAGVEELLLPETRAGRAVADLEHNGVLEPR